MASWPAAQALGQAAFQGRGFTGEILPLQAAQGLVDEYHLMVHPVVLGKGKRLFSDGAAGTDLELVESRKVGPDVLVLTYRPASSPADKPDAG